MPKVHVLPEHIASQIAAGEVVERPSSVVKELVENAIDAQASKIVISINKSCTDIRVADNGLGMGPDDAVLAFQRHATSKIVSADQLWDLHTLGFRGEALPSIAAVTRMTCTTRTADSTIGTRIEAADGILKASETGCAAGTIMSVHDLFYNVPARMKFLKKAATEFAHTHEIVQSLSIAYPAIAFELYYNDNLRLATKGTDELTEAILQSSFLSGQEALLETSANDEQLGLKLHARLSSPKHFRGDRKGILTIVNRRPVRCSVTYKALDYAYSDLIPRGRFPLAVTILTVQPRDLDINIHPTKKEIKYANSNDIYAFLHREFNRLLRQPKLFPFAGLPGHETNNDTIADTIYGGDYGARLSLVAETNHGLEAGMESDLNTDRAQLFEFARPTPSSWGTGAIVDRKESRFTHRPGQNSADILTLNHAFSQNIGANGETSTYQQANRKPSCLPLDWRVVGYIHNTYILIETAAGLSIIEQHIAHERFLYEKFLAQSEAAHATHDHMQQLIISAPLNLSPQQKACLEQHLDSLKAMGFDFEKIADEYICQQVPVELAHKDYATVIQEILDGMLENCDSNARLEVIKSLACQAAIKNGMPLSQTAIHELLQDWYQTPRNETCPHGRPIQLAFSLQKLFQLFHPQ